MVCYIATQPLYNMHVQKLYIAGGGIFVSNLAPVQPPIHVCLYLSEEEEVTLHGTDRDCQEGRLFEML